MIKINTNLKRINGEFLYPDSFEYLRNGKDFHAMWDGDGNIQVETTINDKNYLNLLVKDWIKKHPRTTVKVNYDNGDSMITWINLNADDTRKFYAVGSSWNIGTCKDYFVDVSSVEILKEWNADE